MGQTTSHSESNEKFYRPGLVSETIDVTASSSSTGFVPFDLLIDVLSYVPADDLIITCRLVCKLWKDIIDEHSVWKIKCKRYNKFIPLIRFNEIPSHFYRNIFIYNPYKRNLLKNNCGEDKLNHWVVCIKGGDGIAIENPPKGADPVPLEVGRTSCFATSFTPSMKYQFIDLYELKVLNEVLNLTTTKIEIGEWYAARFDCSSSYELTVLLLDSMFDINKIKNSYEFANNYEDVFSQASENVVDEFRFDFTEEQWAGSAWHLAHHTFDSVSRVRYVLFLHIGKDCQFWAGHFGSKMTGGYVKLEVQ